MKALAWALLAMAVLTACSGGGRRNSTSTVGSGETRSTAVVSSAAQTAAAASHPCGVLSSPPAMYRHVIWIWMENQSFGSVIGSAAAPFTSRMARLCGVAANYATVGSPSLPNYIGATAGSTFGIADDAAPGSHRLTADNLFRQVRSLGGTEKTYAEGMPANCAQGNSGAYLVRHNPAAYFTGGDDRRACRSDDVPLGTPGAGALVDDLNADTLPTFAFIVPNRCNDMHDCSVATGDAWLAKWVPMILESAAYRSNDAALFIVWDEPTPVANVIIAPSVTPGTVARGAFNHYSLLRTTEEMLGIGDFLGAASTAASMRAAFGM